MALSGHAALKRLLSANKVPEGMQEAVLEAGAESVKDFARMFADANDVRQTASSEFGIELEAGLRGRLQVARLVMAWESANAQAAKMVDTLEGDEAAEAQRVPPAEGNSEGSGGRAAGQQVQTEQHTKDDEESMVAVLP